MQNLYGAIFIAFIALVPYVIPRVGFIPRKDTFTSTNSVTFSNNTTVVSSSGVFELGLFKTAPNEDGWYLGVWYKTIPERTYIWVANRDNPLSDSTGTLKLSDNKLLLLDQVNTPVWSWNLREREVRAPMVAELLDNGNFVLRVINSNNQDGILWQSFDFPTDTLLPQMKLGWDRKTRNNRFLTSWRSPTDPSSGEFSYKLETRGLGQFYVWKSTFKVFRSGPWDGITFSGIPEMQEWNKFGISYSFTDNTEETAFSFLGTDGHYTRLSISDSGLLELSTWDLTTARWTISWLSSTNPCDLYENCGRNSYCDPSTSPICNCIAGFHPTNSHKWDSGDGSSGCERRTPLRCSGGDVFLTLKKMKLPETTMTKVDRSIGLKECQDKCLRDCNCTAFANPNVRNGGLGCVIWTGDLVDMRNYVVGGQDLYVRLAAAADLADESSSVPWKIIYLIIGISIVLLLSVIVFCLWKRKQNRASIVYRQRSLDHGLVLSRGRHLTEENTSDLELPQMELNALVMATQNFSDFNKLGHGGFGSVYKGRLANGRDVAVKRLSEGSEQGTDEFKNEVNLIARLQHINLVRLLGCCVENDEKILIYEFLENGSLDSHIFDNTRRSKLNWQQRFDIITGIARGILYLHRDSRCMIIHRDLKASNILLDKDMTPKISDFGLARIFARDHREAITERIGGTYGYMSPEYATHGIFSVKSDVYSFGVLLLEMVSGKKSSGFYNSDEDSSLMDYAWRHWSGGNGLEILDPIIVSPSAFGQEILNCIKIGLLCVQQLPEDRPTMSSVMVMLGSEAAAVIPEPKRPVFSAERRALQDVETLTVNDVNEVTLSEIEPR